MVTIDQSKEELLRDWKQICEDLFEQTKAWAVELGWLVDEYLVRIEERRLGEYHLRELVMHAKGHRLLLTPVARDVVGGEGRVDLEMFPTMARMILVRSKGNWVLKSDSGVPWPDPWSKDTLDKIIDLLADAS